MKIVYVWYDWGSRGVRGVRLAVCGREMAVIAKWSRVMEAKHQISPAQGGRSFAICEDRDGVSSLSGDLTVMDLAELHEFLESRLKSSEPIVLSLECLDSIHIGAIQMLISFKRSLPPQMRFHILSISPRVRWVLAVSGLGGSLIG